MGMKIIFSQFRKVFYRVGPEHHCPARRPTLTPPSLHLKDKVIGDLRFPAHLRQLPGAIAA
jgi:hypothetical protein